MRLTVDPLSHEDVRVPVICDNCDQSATDVVPVPIVYYTTGETETRYVCRACQRAIRQAWR